MKMVNILSVFLLLLGSMIVYAQIPQQQPFVTIGMDQPSASGITPIATAGGAAAAEKDISQLTEAELLTRIKADKVSDQEYQKITSSQLSDKVRSEMKDLAKLNAGELGRSFGFDLLSIRDAKDIKYQDKKLVHPKGGTLDIEVAKGKKLVITGDKFIILEGEKGITLDGKLKNIKIDKDGTVHAGKFGRIKGNNELALVEGDSPDELLTTAESIEVQGKTVKNPTGAKLKTIVHDNGDFGAEVLEGKGVSIVNQLDKERKIEVNVAKGDKYYAINNNQKHGMQKGGSLIYTQGDKSHILTSDAHAIYLFNENGQLGKVIAGYQATEPVAAMYTEKINDIPLRKFETREGAGFTIYKEGSTADQRDPGTKIEETIADDGKIAYDLFDKKTLKGKLTFSTNGVDAFITPNGVKTESIAIKRIKELYAAAPETTISVGKHEITMSPSGDTDVSRNPFKTMVETIPSDSGNAARKFPVSKGEYTSISDLFRDYGYEGGNNFAARKQVYESLFPNEVEKYRGTTQQNIKLLNILRNSNRIERIDQLLSQQEETLSAEQQRAIINNAQQLLKVPYEWGGIDDTGIDCSGLVCRTYNRAGLNLPRWTANGYYNSYALKNTGGRSLEDIAKFSPGMACFWWNRPRTRISHTGIYIGNGDVIHASGNAGEVVQQTLTEIIPERFAGCYQLQTT